MRIYFMGICGTAMGNAALLMKEAGHDVLGADTGVYPPMSEVLAAAGIEVLEGFDAPRLASLRPDQVVVGNAMSRGNPEVEWLLEQSEIAYTSLPQLFHESLLPGRQSIVVAGTHGKTTTSSMLAHLLACSGAEPGWLIGGVPRDLPSGACLGKGRPFVIEGDEYDSAFFDKRSKFIHYRPKIAVLNNLEFDHADIFRDLEDVQRTFRHLLRLLPRSGYVLINGDDLNLLSLLPAGWTQVLRVGCGPENDLRLVDFEDTREGAVVSLHWRGQFWQRIGLSLYGQFNARNAAMAALAANLALGTEPGTLDLGPLETFRGVRRRQDILHAGEDWVVLEDFAHHPTAVTGTLHALRAAYPERTLLACFEPRSNTAATACFQNEFIEAFTAADEIYLGPVYRAERMAPSDRLDTRALAAELTRRGRTARSFDDYGTLAAQLRARLVGGKGPGLMVFLTNGAFDGIPKKTAGILAGGLKA